MPDDSAPPVSTLDTPALPVAAEGAFSCESKPFYRSKILWLNALAAGLVVLEAKTDLLQPLLPVNVYGAVAVALPVANAVLRVWTNQGVTFSGDGGK